ncbi:ATP-dependent helicase [bacterium]|nr:ATP-dependent helicase [bacterium]
MTQQTESLRPAQREILAYTGGKLAIAAVPGAGKTFILTRLSAKLIEEGHAKPSEILILTYMRSAASTFKRRIATLLAERNLSAYGLTASTIHAFCLSVIKRHYERYASPDETGDGLLILSEAEQELLLLPHLDVYLQDPAARKDWEKRYRTSGNNPREEDPRRRCVTAARKAISAAKNFALTPDEVEGVLGTLQPEIPYLYRAYLAELKLKRAVDYDDQVQQAIALLETNEHLRRWYQKRHRFVMEDEAQDSTPAQNRLISLLTAPEHGGSGNLVRVGDSNQAITSSFTFNDPRFFRAFCEACAAEGRRVTMDESSRSGQPIMDLANTLIAISREHPDPVVREAFDRIAVRAATAGKPNPDSRVCGVRWKAWGSKDEERHGILTEIRTYLQQKPEARVAVLCPTNPMADAYRDGARLMGIPVYEGGANQVEAGPVITVLKRALHFLAIPAKRQAEAFVSLLEATASARREPLFDLKGTRAHLMSQGVLDGLIYPTEGLAPSRPANLHEADYASAVLLARRIRTLLGARHLPPLELLPTIAHELLGDPKAEVLASKAAAIARDLQGRLPYQPTTEGDAWIDLDDPLAQVQAALDELAITVERRAIATTNQELAPAKPGEVEFLTLHKSKGAEYEAVWIPNLGYYYENKTWFPWRLDEVEIWDKDAFMAEQLLIHARSNPRPALEALEHAARQVAVAEKLRLLYVGITRAEERLTLSAYGFKPERMAPWHLKALTEGLGA